jgi:predicted ATPase
VRIESVQVRNYKCFLDSGELVLGPGLNIFVGKNDVGKSALVEALGGQLQSRPHRSIRTQPTTQHQVQSDSCAETRYAFTAAEFQLMLSRQSTVVIPKQDGDPGAVMTALTQAASPNNPIPVSLHVQWVNADIRTSSIPAITGRPTGSYFVLVNSKAPAGLELRYGSIQQGQAQDYTSSMAYEAKALTYVFRAERLNVAECAIGGQSALRPDASNLADVLNQLSSANPLRYERLLSHVRAIFPHVTQITAPAVGGNQVRALVWTVPASTERADLAIPLSDSGTGIGQVLAMLYVVVTSERPTTIVIDEPQSFLHPGAIRKLIEILRTYSQHQYVITTHSPLALSTLHEDRVFMVRRGDGGSVVTQLDPSRQADLREFLADVGASLSDVFGADRILWVEGKTEEICFPQLITVLAKRPLSGTQIIGVVSTDELGTRKAERIYEIYEKLSSGPSLMPPAVAFVFDREGKTERERQDVDRRSRGLVHWLPARMYENYLLGSSVIAEVLNQLPEAVGASSPEQVEAAVGECFRDPSFYPGKVAVPSDVDVQSRDIDGARVLRYVFDKLTGGAHRYDKVRHGFEITRALLRNPTPDIQCLADWLAKFATAES